MAEPVLIVRESDASTGLLRDCGVWKTSWKSCVIPAAYGPCEIGVCLQDLALYLGSGDVEDCFRL